ncbi:PilZ domain-containing protein [Ideonella sp. YS5]|uniref:PilZ domain-containing protein n=1 Tax=Ideonella sp. YS5 TaxID=3453714 RepID=UPI003EECE313
MKDDKREALRAAIADALDRRRGMRKPLCVPAGMVVAGKQLTVRTVDIGVRGLSIEADEALPSQAECHIVFNLPVEGRAHTLRLHATVVHAMRGRSQEYKVGLALSNIGAQDLRLIEQFLA